MCGKRFSRAYHLKRHQVLHTHTAGAVAVHMDNTDQEPERDVQSTLKTENTDDMDMALFPGLMMEKN